MSKITEEKLIAHSPDCPVIIKHKMSFFCESIVNKEISLVDRNI